MRPRSPRPPPVPPHQTQITLAQEPNGKPTGTTDWSFRLGVQRREEGVGGWDGEGDNDG